MRIIGKNHLKPGQSGYIQIRIDNIEDLWDLYNIMAVGDNIKLCTFRKVQKNKDPQNLKNKKSELKKIKITLRIENIDYSPESIRIKGKNITENEYIAKGQYHNDELGLNSEFMLYKNFWDDFHIETLKKATDILVTSEIAAILMEEGLANLFFLTNNQTIHKGKVSKCIPKKRNGSSQHDKGKEHFFDAILKQLITLINFENIKVLIIASPGFTKDDFKKYMEQKIVDNLKEWDNLKKNLNKIIYTHSSSAFKHSLEEIMTNSDIKRLIKDTKCVDEFQIMERFNEILGINPDKIFYGHKEFNIAYEKDAIDTFIVTDGYLRKLSPSIRIDLSAKMKKLEANVGTQVCKFSSLNPSGETIDEYGGICGITKYVIDELNELDDEGEEEKEVENNIDNEEIKDENLIAMLNDNFIKEEEDKEDEKEKKEDNNKKKKTKEELKNISIQKNKKRRKRSSIGDEDEAYNDDDDYY